jgi:hypothetical protein
MLPLNQRTNRHKKIGDADADPNCSLSDDFYSDTPDNKSSSVDEINVSALNETQRIDLTTRKENRKPKSRKRNRAVTSDWKRNKTNLLLNTQHAFIIFKKGTEIPERKIRPPCGATCGLKSFSQFSEQERVDIFKIY